MKSWRLKWSLESGKWEAMKEAGAWERLMEQGDRTERRSAAEKPWGLRGAFGLVGLGRGLQVDGFGKLSSAGPDGKGVSS